MAANAWTCGWRFWGVYASLCLLSFIGSVDISIVTTSLPGITQAISGERQSTWIANSYPLASAVPQTLYAQISNVIGRRRPLLFAVSLFALGSGIAGGAINPAMLIAGRVVQGLGVGGIYVLSEIIISDLVPLRQRSQFMGVFLSITAVGATAGPLLGGAIVRSNWRWIFYLNIPASGLTLLGLFFAFNAKSKSWEGCSVREFLSQLDLLGTAIFIPAMVAVLFGLITGGVEYPWSSFHVIVPFVLGLLGWALFHAYESFCKSPSVPSHLFRNRTTAAGYGMACLTYILAQATGYFLPVYFMVVSGASPLKSGVDCLAYIILCMVAAVLAGWYVSKSGCYRAVFWVGFALQAIGYGLLSTLGSSYSQSRVIGYQALVGFGSGVLIPALPTAIMSPLPEADVAVANGVYSFLRSVSFVLGVTLASIVFNDQFKAHADQISDGLVRDRLVNSAYGYASGRFIPQLSPPTRQEVLGLYVDALRAVWYMGIAGSCVGFCLGLVTKHVPMRTELDTEYGLEVSATEKGDT